MLTFRALTSHLFPLRPTHTLSTEVVLTQSPETFTSISVQINLPILVQMVVSGHHSHNRHPVHVI